MASCSAKGDEGENLCRSQPRTLHHYFRPVTPKTARKALETPKRKNVVNQESREEALLCTPDNFFSPSPLKKPPTLLRKRRLSTVYEDEQDIYAEDEEDVLSQRLKKIKVGSNNRNRKTRKPLPCYFNGDDFDLEDWREKAGNVGATRDSSFCPMRDAKLGRGDFATVYRMTNSIQAFAMKESRRMDDWRKFLFLREAQALALVGGHPNIVRYESNWLREFSVGGDEQQVIVMELCDFDLQEDTFGGEFTEARLRKILKDIMSALAYIHSLGMVHMDVKPANILVSTCELSGLETFKLADFGMATRMDGKGATGRGTIRYMDTYHVGWRADAEKGDVFSLGATICDLCSGQQLSYELTQECVEKTWLDEIPDVSEPLKLLLKDMLAMKREDRPTAQQVLERVEKMND